MKFSEFENPVFGRLLLVLLCLVGIVLVGTIGYCALEGWSVSDSFHMTVITLSTVGYGETHPLSSGGRWFTNGLIFACLITMTGSTAVLTSFMVEGTLSGYFASRRTSRMIDTLTGHTIVCGSGPIAAAVIERLMRRKTPLVVVDDNTERLAVLRKKFRNLLVVEGSGSDELHLASARLLDASNVVAAMDSELDNLLICITCRDLGDHVSVIAKSNDTTISNRMRKAGVSEVISPYQLSGERVVDMIAG